MLPGQSLSTRPFWRPVPQCCPITVTASHGENLHVVLPPGQGTGLEQTEWQFSTWVPWVRGHLTLLLFHEKWGNNQKMHPKILDLPLTLQDTAPSHSCATYSTFFIHCWVCSSWDLILYLDLRLSQVLPGWNTALSHASIHPHLLSLLPTGLTPQQITTSSLSPNVQFISPLLQMGFNSLDDFLHRILRNDSLSQLCTQNHRTSKAGKDLWDHPVQPTTYCQHCPLNHIPQCHTYTFPEHVQAWWLHHLPGQPVPVPDHSLEKQLFLIPKLNLPWSNLRPFPLGQTLTMWHLG